MVEGMAWPVVASPLGDGQYQGRAQQLRAWVRRRAAGFGTGVLAVKCWVPRFCVGPGVLGSETLQYQPSADFCIHHCRHVIVAGCGVGCDGSVTDLQAFDAMDIQIPIHHGIVLR